MDAYFAYGSNLEPVQMNHRCPGSRIMGRAVLRDFCLSFPVLSDGDWAGGVASVDPQPGEQVYGVVFHVTAADLAALDDYEAVAQGLYDRLRVPVDLLTGERRDAWIYRARPDPAGPFTPSAAYMQALRDGAAHHGLPAAYQAELAGIPTRAER